MTYAQKVNGSWVELLAGNAVAYDGVQASYETVNAWLETERNAFGVFTIIEGEAPPLGKIVSSRKIGTKNSRPVWVNTFADAPTPEPVAEVTSAQAQVALYNAGLLEAVEDKIANHPYPPIRIWFRSARNWRKDNPYVIGMAAELKLTDEQFNDLFSAASAVIN